jgi:hypothetical protein
MAINRMFLVLFYNVGRKTLNCLDWIYLSSYIIYKYMVQSMTHGDAYHGNQPKPLRIINQPNLP